MVALLQWFLLHHFKTSVHFSNSKKTLSQSNERANPTPAADVGGNGRKQRKNLAHAAAERAPLRAGSYFSSAEASAHCCAMTAHAQLGLSPAKVEVGTHNNWIQQKQLFNWAPKIFNEIPAIITGKRHLLRPFLLVKADENTRLFMARWAG